MAGDCSNSTNGGRVMTGVVNDYAKPLFLAAKLAGIPFIGGRLRMGLGTANFSPSETSVLADFIEATFPGYTRPLIGPGWTPPVLTAAHTALSSAPAVSFTNTAGVATPLIYTWFWIDTLPNEIVMAGVFDLPYQIPAGQSAIWTPAMETTGD